jgi:hypothetical protein
VEADPLATPVVAGPRPLQNLGRLWGLLSVDDRWVYIFSILCQLLYSSSNSPGTCTCNGARSEVIHFTAGFKSI